MKKLLLLLLCLSVMPACNHNDSNSASLAQFVLTVTSRHRDGVNESELGSGALDYSKLEGVLAELITDTPMDPPSPRAWPVIFESTFNNPKYLACRPGDAVALSNKSQRPLTLDSFDLPGFPIELAAGETKHISIQRICRNAVIYDMSDTHTLIVSCQPHHTQYLKMNEPYVFGSEKDAPLHYGPATLSFMHPRFPKKSMTVYLKKGLNHPEPFLYSLGPLNPSDKSKAILPQID